MKKPLTALLVLSALALSGCGQTGPLYMPKDKVTNQAPSTNSSEPTTETQTQSAQ